MAAEAGYPCPCCGHLAFGEPPGSYGICGVCFWEDDPVQLRCDRAQVPRSRARGRPSGPREAGWCPVDLAVDDFEAPRKLPGPATPRRCTGGGRP
ncbi:hypothetical protein MUY14_45345 [Amycolatopsis sp. FBCC-B4732]|uniref:CPCC family cysteine-rich protein n=1 Tax=Amycolatopsis sp. FBCC-B4732 TaxID=3079339 RepID=UPI001FF6ABC3|nr:CPCC family cysteine-rich protein [Amycolatopsis sp. FBCC-B4732]UOX88817.1 hypothetical protein MUY14_45345 [Amycolatopsis sp. FBCC-B4732]